MVQHDYLVTPWLIGLCDVQCLLAITHPVTWALTFPATDWWTLYCTCVTLCTVYNMMPCLKPWRFFHSGKLQAASLTTVCQCDSAFMLCWPLWPLAAVIQCFHALMKDSMLQKLPPPKPLPVPYLTALVERTGLHHWLCLCHPLGVCSLVCHWVEPLTSPATTCFFPLTWSSRRMLYVLVSTCFIPDATPPFL